jgi:hypothetical protein
MNQSYEQWRPVLGLPPHYEASSLGRIRSLDHEVVAVNRWGSEQRYFKLGTILKLQYRAGKYVSFGTSGKTHSVHRAVALAFLGAPPDGKPWVNHRNGNKHDNQIENLEWSSIKEQAWHRVHVLGKDSLPRPLGPARPPAPGRQHRLLTYQGDTLTQAEWSQRLGFSQQVIYRRLKAGWSVAETLSTPLIPRSLRNVKRQKASV